MFCCSGLRLTLITQAAVINGESADESCRLMPGGRLRAIGLRIARYAQARRSAAYDCHERWGWLGKQSGLAGELGT
jgi:hypothetical protein